MSSRLTLSDLSPKHQAEVARQLAGGKVLGQSLLHGKPVSFGVQTVTVDIPKEYTELMEKRAKKRLRQSTKPVMNKLETRFYEDRLVPDYVSKDQPVLIQAVRLELARGIWYKADFFLPAVNMGPKHVPQMRGAIAYEVKGPKVFRGGFENLKVAARVHPWITFFLVWENRETGQWERQEILP